MITLLGILVGVALVAIIALAVYTQYIARQHNKLVNSLHAVSSQLYLLGEAYNKSMTNIAQLQAGLVLNNAPKDIKGFDA